MKLGEIYVWETDKAKGHVSRKKYQIFICPADERDENTFLFINKADYGGSFPIKREDYPFLTLDVSYIGGTAYYDDFELAVARPLLVGELKVEHMKQLFSAIHDSITLTGAEILRVGNALKAILR